MLTHPLLNVYITMTAHPTPDEGANAAPVEDPASQDSHELNRRAAIDAWKKSLRPGMRPAAAVSAAEVAPPPPPPPPPPPRKATTLDKMTYWLHGRKGFPVQRADGSPRPATDRSWLPRMRSDRYLLSNPDPGGFNNIRLAFENNVAMALLLGRTLVLPRKRSWYLLGHVQLGFEDFFDMADLNKLVPCISFDEYEKLLGSGAANKATLLKMQPLRHAFAYPSVEKVTEAYDPKVLKYGVADRTLIDSTATSTSFSTSFRAFLSSASPCTRCVLCSTWCPC